MCRMALGVLWYNSTYEFIIETLVVPLECLWNSEKMCSMTSEVLWTNSTNGFILISGQAVRGTPNEISVWNFDVFSIHQERLPKLIHWGYFGHLRFLIFFFFLSRYVHLAFSRFHSQPRLLRNSKFGYKTLV